jgi:hypothetical protein
MKSKRSWCAYGCSVALLISPQPVQGSQNQGLEIVVLQGENATHLVNYHRQEQLVVLARLNGQPAKGVAINFELPGSGPGGDFTTPRTKTLRVMTGKNGRATAKGFIPNKEVGSYVVRVTAEHQGQIAKVEVPQQNAFSKTAAADNRKFRNNIIFGGAVIGGVLVVTAILATRAWN